MVGASFYPALGAVFPGGCGLVGGDGEGEGGFLGSWAVEVAVGVPEGDCVFAGFSGFEREADVAGAVGTEEAFSLPSTKVGGRAAGFEPDVRL